MEHIDRWQELCDQAKDDSDSEELIELVEEIIQLLGDDDRNGSARYPALGSGKAQRFLH